MATSPAATAPWLKPWKRCEGRGAAENRDGELPCAPLPAREPPREQHERDPDRRDQRRRERIHRAGRVLLEQALPVLPA